MTPFKRFLRHLWLDTGDTRRALDDAAMARLQSRVQASEQHHSGEIRVVVEASLPWSYLWRGLPARARALTLFGKLRVWDTEHNNGVLVYLLLADHAIEIVADRGLARQVPQAHWDGVLAHMQQAFRQRQFEAGLTEAIDRVDEMLRLHFPLAPGQRNPNELPDLPQRG